VFLATIVLHGPLRNGTALGLNAWFDADEVQMNTFSRTNGFTLLEMLVAMTVAAILTAVSLNVYSVIHQGALETAYHYGQFVSEKVDELRCRTRFVRGLPPCDDVPCEGAFCGSRMNVRERF
jgi:prepilin-type N-terminal cleavage/methylation domain-containing protein